MTLYLILAMAAVALAYANGANDNFKAAATVYGSGALSYKRALKLATLAQLSGSVASLFLAAVLVKAFTGKGLVPDDVVADPVFRCAVGAGAALAVLLATRLGLPISTTHALIGGLAGAGLAAAPATIAWGALGGKFFLPLLLCPLLAVAVTAGLYPVARALRKCLGIEADSCICVEQTQAVPQADGVLLLHAEAPPLVLSADHRCTPPLPGPSLRNFRTASGRHPPHMFGLLPRLRARPQRHPENHGHPGRRRARRFR